MRSHNLFLLIYLLGSCSGASSAQSNANCAPYELCGQVSDSASHFLQCVGLPPTDTGGDYIHRLKGMLEGMMDVYTFMRSSMTGVPVLSLQQELQLNHRSDPLQNEALVQMWMEVKIKPLLKSITKKFLTCLSTKNFSCSTYQIVVRELSHHYSEMNPVRQKWIYTFFMYPFLSGDRVAGCLERDESNEQWLMKNFGAFRAMARMNDFSTLNMYFSGLNVLQLLSPVQKAELLMRPEVVSLDNGTLDLVFNNLLTGGSGPHPTTTPPNTTPGFSPQPPYNPYHPPSITQVVNGFMMAFRPAASFAHEFVSFTRERPVSEISSITLTQFLLNWTLVELADIYRPTYTPAIQGRPKFDFTNVEDWYQQVVIPLLRRFLSNDAALMHENVTLAFHQVFYLDHDMDPDNYSENSEILDVCSITLDKAPCGLTDVVVTVANILHCAARTNFTMSEATVMRLILELTGRLNSLIKELSQANFTELASDIRQIFDEEESPSLTQDHLNDPDFIKLWFQVKLMPFLHDIPRGLLSCLSTKNFSCPVFQTLVAELSKHMRFMDSNPMYGENIYKYFIYPFLRHNNTSDPHCVSSANNSAEWIRNNFGFFARFAPITDFYRLNSNFSGLEVLHHLTPKQTAELLLLPLPTPPEKDVVISRVFDFLMQSNDDSHFLNVLHYLVLLARQVNPPCRVYQLILERLYEAIPFLSDHEPAIWAGIDDLINLAPEECLAVNITCPAIQFNGTSICRGIDSSDLDSYLNMYKNVSCSFTLETYACAKLENFTANQLVSLLTCNLPGNSSHSNVLWKILLTKLSIVLDPALDILANMPYTTVIPSAREVLDVIGEIRVSLLTDEQLRNSSIITKWFSGRVSRLLPSASGRVLRCLSRRNLSCHSYQQILQVFIHHFDSMTLGQQQVVLKDFVLRFLSHSGPDCVAMSNSSVDWLMRNLGPFSWSLSLEELLHLNTNFNPLDALRLLTPKQTAELVVLNLPTLPDKDVIINMVFDHLTQSDEQIFRAFLSYLHVLFQPGNFSCSSHRTLFTRLDLALTTASPYVESSIIHTMTALSKYIPADCIINSGECNVTMINETDLCTGVNSTMLQLYLDSRQLNGRFCDFAVEEFACASLSALTAEDLAAILPCNRFSDSSSSRPVWKLFLSKASPVLNEALYILSSRHLNPGNPALTIILDVIREIRLDAFGRSIYNNPVFIQLWFNGRLLPFLPAVSSDFLSCLATREFNCSTYQRFVQIFSHLQPHMDVSRQMSVYRHFIKAFLTRNNTTDLSCSLNTNNSGDWLQKNLGGFSVLLSFHDLLMLYPNFTALEALALLTARQLAEMSATPGQLASPEQVNIVMEHIPDQQLAAFFDDFSPAIMGNQHMFPPGLLSAMLQVVFDRANLSDPSVSDSAVSIWFNNRLPPLLVNLSDSHVAPFFSIQAGRNCSIQWLGVKHLNSTMSSLSEVTRKEIHNHIIQSLREPIPLQCYNNSQSFYTFLLSTFMGFQFPNLTSFLSIIPRNRLQQVLNSMPSSDLGYFLHLPDVVDSDTELCVIYNNYIHTPVFLETEPLPEAVQRPTLPCVWPMALSSSNRSEVNAWFDRRLRNYLVFLTKSLISRINTYNASCLAFQKLVSVLGEFNFTSADFMRRDVFNTIRDYLASETVPRCYNPNDAELNSTAWFAEYIGPFMPFLTLEDLQKFGSAKDVQVFTVNPHNIALLNHSILPLNLTNYYTELVYQEDSNFNPLLLPLLCRCVAPGPAFTQLTAAETMIILHNLTTLCTDLDPQIASALASNLGDNIDATAIAALGSESTGISTKQITMINPEDLLATLGTLGNVTGWNQGQANAIVQSLMSSGLIQFNSSSSLLMLGSLIAGVPTSVFSSISGSQLIAASKDPSFVANLINAPQIVQLIFVAQIISVNGNSDNIIENVPDELATEIPRTLLLAFSNDDSNIIKINQKNWEREQAEIIFEFMATESSTTVLGGPNNLSSLVLQGFTCTGVRNIKKEQIRRLIQACRRTGRNKVLLVEPQLTCMYNHIKGSDPTSFQLYPPDVLLYYDYSLVPEASCRDYFQELADADFSVFSSDLSYKRTELFANAKSCLGIISTSLTEDHILVLGNMCCTLNGSYIENSHPSILEKLKICPDLTDAQAAAVLVQLQRGNTQYGDPSTWNEETLRDLGMLPLYLSSTFYGYFDRQTKENFLEYFLEVLENIGVDGQKKTRMKEEIRESIQGRSKRSTGTITQVTISGKTFPFAYDDIDQFKSCLSPDTVKNNLASIIEKVDLAEYLTVILSKIREAYAAQSEVPEEQVQLLGVASRQASDVDINMWSITKIDTLAALFDPSDGVWNERLAEAIISKYLKNEGNKLGSAELNVIGVNLCSLDADVLKNISQQTIRDTKPLNVSVCTLEKKRILFIVARLAFVPNTRTEVISASTYQLIRTYLSGANLSFIRCLSVSGINMDLPTLISLDETVVMALSVNEVKQLLGDNLADLKAYDRNPLIMKWVAEQPQSLLDELELGLIGGKIPTVTTVTSSPSSSPVTATTGTTGSSATTDSSGVHIHAEAAFIIIVLLITSQLFLT